MMNTLKIAGKLARLKVYTLGAARSIADDLLTYHSCTFKIEPLPDGEYEITTKDEGLLERVLEGIDLDQPGTFVVEEIPPEQDHYLSSGGQACPNCGSKDIVACGFDQANKDGWQKIECEGCCATWTDQYKLTGFTDLEVSNNEE